MLVVIADCLAGSLEFGELSRVASRVKWGRTQLEHVSASGCPGATRAIGRGGQARRLNNGAVIATPVDGPRAPYPTPPLWRCRSPAARSCTLGSCTSPPDVAGTTR